jgi:hypothetical protein
MRLRYFLLAMLLTGSMALAQGNPGLFNGQIPTATNWNSYFAAKADVSGGSMTNPTITSGTITGNAISGGSISGATITGGSLTTTGANLTTPTISGGTFTGGPTISSPAITGGTLTGSTLVNPIISGGSLGGLKSAPNGTGIIPHVISGALSVTHSYAGFLLVTTDTSAVTHTFTTPASAGDKVCEEQGSTGAITFSGTQHYSGVAGSTNGQYTTFCATYDGNNWILYNGGP